MSPDGDTTISAIFRSKLRDIAPSRQSPRSCKHDFGSLLAGIKVDCSVLTHSHNRYPNSQSGLSPYLFIRVSPSNVYVIADASILHNIAAVREFYSKYLKKITFSQRKRMDPNDPCPCGSRKKYKKCRGKK